MREVWKAVNTKLFKMAYTALAIAAIGWGTHVGAQSTWSQPPSLLVSAGDLLDVSVFDSPELSAKLRVSNVGEIQLPVGGPLEVSNKTAEQVARSIEALLRERDIVKAPHVTVFISEYATQGVSVLGEVKNPGVFPALGAHRLFDFISVAGGLTPNAGKMISIYRRNDIEHPQNVQWKGTDVSQVNVEILPGDTVIVSKSGIVYVVGDLQRPGGFLIENSDRLTVLQAISLAQGATKTAALNRTKLIRKGPQGRTEIGLRLKEILDGHAEDMRLEDGDILYVPNSQKKEYAYRGIEAAIQMTIGMATYGRF